MIYLDVVLKSPLTQLFTYSNEDRVLIGSRVLVSFGNRELVAIIISNTVKEPKGFTAKPIRRVIDEEPLLSKELIQLAYIVADYSFCSLGEILFAMIPSAEVEKEGNGTSLYCKENLRSLTDEQNKAINLLSKGTGIFYLYGVTGSGKTAVLIEIMKKIVDEGKDIIYLVPEISLAQQTFQTVRESFNTAVIFHSALTVGQRLKTWRSIQGTSASIVVGTRSAIFTPVQKLGLIIIDEEHDSSYKASSTPRFHARQVAMMRQKQSDCKLVMASATPSLEAFYAMETGVFKKVTLTQRATGAQLPQYKVIDMRRESSIFSRLLVSEILKSKALGKQSIIFLNRKGFTRYYSCPDCGFQLTCQHCSISLTYHKNNGKLICHYCGSQKEPPQCCPQCQSKNAGYQSFGLDKVEEEAQRLFGHLKILKLDGDLAKKKGEAMKIVQEFSDGNADILLATQIAAKGFNFPFVRLVAITLADVGLALPDFRAEERTFALLMQIAGRAGRFNNEDIVIVQTYRPDNKAISSMATSETDKFYHYELKMREMSGFPPFSRLIKVTFRSKNDHKCQDAVNQFAEDMVGLLDDDDEILGPAPSPIKRAAGVYRYQVILRTHHYNRLKKQLTSYFHSHTVPSSLYREVDNDPVSLL